MKIVKSIFAATAFAGTLFASTASGAIVISVQTPDSPFVSNSGVQSVNVFARGNGGIGSADSGIVLTVDFELGSGASFSSPDPGIFGSTGFIGAGNINADGSDFLRDPNSASIGSLSIEFLTLETFLLTDRLLATLLIDTTGLTPATYTIDVIDARLDDNLGIFSGGTFEIVPVAIPEPCSLALIIALASGACARKRFKKPLSVVAA